MLIEKYMDVRVEIPAKDPDDWPDIEYEEVYVENSNIKHYIDTFLSAEDVLNYAKEIAPDEFEGDNSADLDLAYDILIDEFDEHDDIPDFANLNEYIQDCVQNDYEDEAAEAVFDAIETAKSDEEHRHWGLL